MITVPASQSRLGASKSSRSSIAVWEAGYRAFLEGNTGRSRSQDWAHRPVYAQKELDKSRHELRVCGRYERCYFHRF